MCEFFLLLRLAFAWIFETKSNSPFSKGISIANADEIGLRDFPTFYPINCSVAFFALCQKAKACVKIHSVFLPKNSTHASIDINFFITNPYK